MAKEKTDEDRSGAEEIQIDIDVVPGRLRATLRKLLAQRRVRVGRASAGLIAALAIAAIVVLSSGRGRAPGPGALARQFGLRTDCTRRTVSSPDGPYARIDLDRFGSCGTFGYQVTLVLHRIRGAWVRDFEASSWTCPVRRLPRSVAIELQLCSAGSVSSRPAAAPPRGVL